jgi:hypothetical protein
MLTFLNLCHRGRQTFLCSLVFLPFFGSSFFNGGLLLRVVSRYTAGPAAALETTGAGVDTIGRTTDRHHRRDAKYWKHEASCVSDRYLSLVLLLRRLQASGKQDAQQIVLQERIRRLNMVLSIIDSLKSDSPYYYNIRRVPAVEGAGATVYDPCSREITFGIQDSSDNTYSFVHEITHGLQFMQGEMVFDRGTGAGVGDDIGDELEAYKNQFAYDIGSIPGIHSFAEIDSSWLRSLRDREGAFLYSPDINGRYNVIGLKTVTIDSDTSALKEAYPNIPAWGCYPYPLKDKYHFFFRKRKRIVLAD